MDLSLFYTLHFGRISCKQGKKKTNQLTKKQKTVLVCIIVCVVFTCVSPFNVYTFFHAFVFFLFVTVKGKLI